MGSLAVGWTAVLFFLRRRTEPYSRRNVAATEKWRTRKRNAETSSRSNLDTAPDMAEGTRWIT